MFKILDLFAGSGGFSLGFELIGHKTHTHIEIDKYASETIKSNFAKSNVIVDDIRFIDPKSLSRNKFDLIIGGPPCQGFSVAGSSQYGIQDSRNELVFHFLNFVQQIKPKLAIMENVPGVLTKKSKDGETFLNLIEKIATEMNYKTKYTTINAKNFGVPQSRKRAFIAFYQNNEFSFPEWTHSDENQKTLLDNFQKLVTVNDAISDLPIVKSGEKGSGLEYKCPPKNKFQQFCRKDSKGITNHDAMRHTDRLLERFKIIEPGKSLKDVPIEHGQIQYGTGKKINKPFKYNNYRLDPKKPSLTIPASFQSLFVHPHLNRNLTAREAARLMSYPDNFIFKGPKTMMSWESGLSQYNQIGNSVCPLVAVEIAKSANNYFKNSDKNRILIKRSKTLVNLLNSLKTNRFTLSKSKEFAQKFKTKKLPRDIDLKTSKFFKDKNFEVNKKIIPLQHIEIAYTLLKNSKIKVCNIDSPPYGDYSNGMNLLISKSNLESLFSKKRDNGLDYHLRVISGIDKNFANEVAKILEDLGIVKIFLGINPRTGKKVKTIKLI